MNLNIPLIFLCMTCARANWELNWHDELDNFGINLTNWILKDNRLENGQCQDEPLQILNCFTNRSRNVDQFNGVLAITEVYENFQGKNFTTGFVQSKTKFGPGKIEIRVAFPEAKWSETHIMADMMGGERIILSILEEEQNEIFIYINGKWNNFKLNEQDNIYQFNIWTFEWNNTLVIWRINDRNIFEETINLNNDDRFALIFYTVMAGKLHTGTDIYLDDIKQWKCPTLLIDYIRYYKWTEIETKNSELISSIRPNRNLICEAIHPDPNCQFKWQDQFDEQDSKWKIHDKWQYFDRVVHIFNNFNDANVKDCLTIEKGEPIFYHLFTQLKEVAEKMSRIIQLNNSDEVIKLKDKIESIQKAMNLNGTTLLDNNENYLIKIFEIKNLSRSFDLFLNEATREGLRQFVSKCKDKQTINFAEYLKHEFINKSEKSLNKTLINSYDLKEFLRSARFLTTHLAKAMVMDTFCLSMKYKNAKKYEKTIIRRLEVFKNVSNNLNDFIKTISNEIKENFLNQVELEVNELAQANQTLNDVKFSRKLFDQLLNKYYWRSWYVCSITDPTIDMSFIQSFCTKECSRFAHLMPRKFGRTVYLSSTNCGTEINSLINKCIDTLYEPGETKIDSNSNSINNYMKNCLGKANVNALAVLDRSFKHHCKVNRGQGFGRGIIDMNRVNELRRMDNFSTSGQFIINGLPPENC